MEEKDCDTHSFTSNQQQPYPKGWLKPGTYVMAGYYDDWIIGPVVCNSFSSFFTFEEGFGSGQEGNDWVTNPKFRWIIRNNVTQNWGSVLRVFPNKETALLFARKLWGTQRHILNLSAFLERVGEGVFDRSCGDPTEFNNLARAVHQYEHASHEALAELVAHVKILTNINTSL